MFWDSKKEGALEYADWRAEVEEYIKKGYEDNKIKDAMLFSLEGKARRNFQHCDEHGDLSPAEILKRMDMSYNASVDFQDLNARLCGLKQGAFQSPKDYYDRMVDIGVALREYHQDRFQPGELSNIEKECFFARLPPTNQQIGREGTPNTTEDDRQARSKKTPEMAQAHWICADRLQCYSVTGNRVLPVLFNVWAEAEVTCRPTIPDSEQPRMDPYHRRVCEGSL